jgi:hypothetical protein
MGENSSLFLLYILLVSIPSQGVIAQAPVLLFTQKLLYKYGGCLWCFAACFESSCLAQRFAVYAG